MKRSLLAGALLTVLLLGACGTREPVTLTETDCRTAAVAADFSITLLRNAAKPDKTTLLSPYSVLLALGMTANGANSATLQEMEQALGAKTDDLNHWLAACRLAEDGKVVSANSLWTRQELEVRKEVRKTIRKQYDAELHEGEFSMEAVNDWVRKNTKGRIEKILEQDDPMSQACLVNALTFDAEWPVAYTPESVYDGTFFTSDGSRQISCFSFMRGSSFADVLLVRRSSAPEVPAKRRQSLSNNHSLIKHLLHAVNDRMIIRLHAGEYLQHLRFRDFFFAHQRKHILMICPDVGYDLIIGNFDHLKSIYAG